MANKLTSAKRVQILSMLVEGSSMRSISRVVDVSINTVTRMLEDAGRACIAHHEQAVQGVRASRIQCDEIWAFCYAKQKNVSTAVAAPDEAGDVWTWTAIDADTKLIVSYLGGGRDAGYAYEFMQDVAGRLANRVQLTTDGHKAYLTAVEGAFGADVSDHGNCTMIRVSDVVGQFMVSALSAWLRCRPMDRPRLRVWRNAWTPPIRIPRQTCPRTPPCR